MFVKVEDIAQFFGVTARRVQQLTQDGVIQTESTPNGRRYDLQKTIKSYIQYLADKAYGRDAKSKEAELRAQKLKAEVALKESQGELHKLKTQIMEGKYLSKEEIQIDYRRFFVVFKKFALSIPTRVTGYISGEVEPTTSRKIESDLNKEINNLLNDFVIAGTDETAPKKGKVKNAPKKDK